MKIPQLLVQYLYTNRKMSLPGLGIFTLDKSVVLPDENDRNLHSTPNAVQFQNANIVAADKELISFICEQTGKIKPLAISDLDSYLNLGMEMLNIGKPFYLEGIGTITKNKAGKFDFSPGEYSLIKETSSPADHDKKKVYAKDKKQQTESLPVQNRTGLKVLAFISALVIVGLGGWMMYKKNSQTASETNPDTSSVVQQQVPVVADTVKRDSVRRDSVAVLPADSPHPVAVVHPGTPYKFIILATDDKPRAMRRYNQLIGFNLKAHYYHVDSTYKVFFQFPALARDTTHIKDSLRKEYAADVTIERE
ncbi:MAG TPA: hypothetical protein VFI33_15935 [Puia sp.]|nr:hypothetical protein [Puia sp.]